MLDSDEPITAQGRGSYIFALEKKKKKSVFLFLSF